MHRTLLVITYMLLLASSGNVVAQNQSGAESNRDDFEALYKDAGDIYNAPAHFDDKDWYRAAAVIGAALVAYTLDEEIRDMTQRNRHDDLDGFVRFGDYYGRPESALGVSASIYLAGLAMGSEHTRKTGRMVFQAAAYSGLLTLVLKSVLGRSRPYINQGSAKFNFFETQDSFMSLPSGHTTIAFAVSSVLAKRIDNIYASFGLYGLATMTAVQRIINDNHWFSDTILGASIGAAIGFAVVNLEQQREIQVSLSQTVLIDGMSPHVPLVQFSIPF
jgi:membrane-associated phospholipid phosphatase